MIARFIRIVGVISVIILNPYYGAIAQVQLNASDVPANPEASQLLESLTPSPDPLELPTDPAQVQLQPTQPITLLEALELAQQHNQDLQIATLILKRSQAALRQARAALFPTLRTEAEIANELTAEDSLDDLEEGDEPEVGNVLSGTIEINYDLFTSGRRTAQIRAAQAQVRLDQMELVQLYQQIRLDVTDAYYDLQQSDGQLQIAQAALTNARRSLTDAISLEAGGLGSRFDIKRARVQLANAEQELLEAESQQDIARRQLVQLLGLGESADVSAADLVQPAEEWTLSLAESIILAYENRVELQQQLVQRDINNQQRRAAVAEAKPQISLFASYQILDDFEDEFAFQDGYAIGARFNWDFFDGGMARAAGRQEEINGAIAENRFAQIRGQIRFQVEQAYKQLQANTRGIETATIALEQAQENLEVARFRFQSGVGTQLEVVTVENDLTRARVNQLRTILNYNRALATLKRAVNSPPDV
ncbi:MAG: TolC family protein [Cyanothece sp. SIO1E1]|nr:TolC family protein [Cyanothece sp. SIO1E1]